MINVH